MCVLSSRTLIPSGISQANLAGILSSGQMAVILHTRPLFQAAFTGTLVDVNLSASGQF